MEPRWSQPPGPRLCSPHCSACSPPSFPFQSYFHTQLMVAKSSDSLKPGVCRTFQHMSAPFQMSAGTDECRASNAKIKHLCVPPPGVPRCYYPTLLCRLPSDQLIVLFDCVMASLLLSCRSSFNTLTSYLLYNVHLKNKQGRLGTLECSVTCFHCIDTLLAILTDCCDIVAHWAPHL